MVISEPIWFWETQQVIIQRYGEIKEFSLFKRFCDVIMPQWLWQCNLWCLKNFASCIEYVQRRHSWYLRRNSNTKNLVCLGAFYAELTRPLKCNSHKFNLCGATSSYIEPIKHLWCNMVISEPIWFWETQQVIIQRYGEIKEFSLFKRFCDVIMPQWLWQCNLWCLKNNASCIEYVQRRHSWYLRRPH